jgi:hypothetical protein
MRIDNVKVGVIEWQDAQATDPNKPQTTVNGATVLWGWAGDDAITTTIVHEGDEIIELDHISSSGNVKSVTQEDGTEGFVLNADMTGTLYPGDFFSPEMRHPMRHKVTVNCK